MMMTTMVMMIPTLENLSPWEESMLIGCFSENSKKNKKVKF